MDPDAALDELLDVVDEALLLFGRGGQPQPSTHVRTAELVDAIDGWIGGGGYRPRGWASGHIRR